MTKTDKVATLLLGAAIGVAAYRFFTMPRFERNEFVEHLKDRTLDLLQNTETTVDRVDHFLAQIDHPENTWLQRLVVIKNMLADLYKNDQKRYLL